MQHEGVEDVRILNGGFEAWKNAGFEIETGSNPKKPVTDFGKPTPAHPEYIIDMPEAKELLKDPNGCLLVYAAGLNRPGRPVVIATLSQRGEYLVMFGAMT